MHFYSFKVVCEDDVVLPEHYLVLGEGFNVFNATVGDLEKFRAKLREVGVEILEANRLDDLEEVPPVTHDLVLPTGIEGSSAALLQIEGSTRHHR